MGGRLVKLTSETFELRKQGRLPKSTDDFVFTRDEGQPVKDFRVPSNKLTVAAELPGLLFHDLRQSAVRNMVRRGVPQAAAMRISGRKTRIFDRCTLLTRRTLLMPLCAWNRVPFVGLGLLDQTSQTEVAQTKAEHQYNQ